MTLFDTCGPTQTPDDIDIEALREKYAQERQKRLRTDGSAQYLEVKDDYAEFAEIDPHTPVTPRAPINEDIEDATGRRAAPTCEQPRVHLHAGTP